MNTSVLSVLFLTLLFGECFGTNKQPKAKLRKDYGKQAEIEDQEHVNRHLKQEIPVENMTERQRHFHYFRMYDYDKNYRIDGLEIIKAITHSHGKHDDTDSDLDDDDEEDRTRPMTDEELEATVDEILKKADANMDGYIVFPEYIKYLVPIPAPPAGQEQPTS